jgi:hypothetical protein
MSESTMPLDAQRTDLGSPPPAAQDRAPIPHPEDEGLSLQEIKWLPLAVPLAALTMLLAGAAVLSTA